MLYFLYAKNQKIKKGGTKMGNNIRIHNWIWQDEVTSKSDGNLFYVNSGCVLATITITGLSTSKVVFEGKSDNDNSFYPIMGVNLSDYSMASETTAKGVVYQVPLEGLTQFRVRVSQYVAGDKITVKGTVVD